MDFDFHEDERQLADLARRILVERATNERLKTLRERGEAWDADLWRALAEAGLLGAAIPERHGGSGLGFLALCLLLREIGRTVAPVPAFPSLVLGALAVAEFGSDAQRAAWLPRLARGEAILTAALVEPGASDLLAPTARAEVRGDGVRLSGTKTMVPYAEQAARVIVPARSDDGAVALFLVDPHGDGVRVAAQTTPDGQPHAQLELTDAPTPADARLGGANDALAWLVQRAIAARCVTQLGVIERALEMTADYGCTRIQFGRPLASFQAYQQRAADAYIDVEAVRLSALEAAWRLSCGLPADVHVAVAKFWAAEGGQAAAYACQHLHGGIGIDVDYPLHRHFVWAIQLEHELGSASRHLDALGHTIAAHGLPPE